MTHERWCKADDPSKNGKLRHPANMNKPLRQSAQEKVTNYQIPLLTITKSPSCPPSLAETPAASTRSSVACYSIHAHWESEEFFRLTGQLAQPNQDSPFSKRAAFFNSLKNRTKLWDI